MNNIPFWAAMGDVVENGGRIIDNTDGLLWKLVIENDYAFLSDASGKISWWPKIEEQRELRWSVVEQSRDIFVWMNERGDYHWNNPVIHPDSTYKKYRLQLVENKFESTGGIEPIPCDATRI